MSKFEKIELLKAYIERFRSVDPAVSEGLRGEYLTVISFHAEEEWRLLDDQEKAKLLKISLSFNRKTGPDEDYTYARNLIELFDELILTLSKINQLIASIPDISNIDFDVLRIYAVLNIEKGYFDEVSPPRSHLESYFFENIATQFSLKHPDLNLGILAVLHKKMYDTWPEKPMHFESESN